MAGDANNEPAGFDDVFPDLEVAGGLLAAIASDDQDAIEELRESPEADWWKVAWTLALLVRDVRTGEPAAVDLVDFLMSGADLPPAGG